MTSPSPEAIIKRCRDCGDMAPHGTYTEQHRGKSRHRTQSRCRRCQRAYGKKHYVSNIETYAERMSGVNARRRAECKVIRDEAKDRPCMDCGIQHPPYVMQFDHREPAEKLFQISDSSQTPERLLAEIAKCDVVCANCHAVRTHRQREAGIFQNMSRHGVGTLLQSVS